MFRTLGTAAVFIAISLQAHAETAKVPDSSLDYFQQTQGGFVEGVLFSKYEVACGYTTRAQIAEAGYLSIFKRVYWLLGRPYENWNFDIRAADFPEDAEVRVSLVVDGYEIDYPEMIKITQGIAGSSSDICKDDMGGYCPSQVNAELLRSVGRKLRSAKSLTFVVSSAQKSELFTMHADFELVETRIDACIGRLLSTTVRSPP